MEYKYTSTEHKKTLKGREAEGEGVDRSMATWEGQKGGYVEQ